MSSSVKQQFVQDMKMAGLAPATQEVYLRVVLRFVSRTRIRPQDATERQVADYLREQIQRGLGQGAIRPTKCALQFIFENTLGRQWCLFKKESPPRVASVCPMFPATRNAAASSRPSAGLCIASVWL
jgi:hypothetical protein